MIGVGYRPRTGTVFFTRNGKKLEDVAHGLKTQNFFPTVGADGPCRVHVNFGQSGFVFIEANVKKWGLAPMTGSLAPPPPYGSEQGSILLEAGADAGQQSSHRGHARTRSRFGAISGQMLSPGPQRSPTDISLAQLAHIPSHEDIGEGSSRGAAPAAGLNISNGEPQGPVSRDVPIDPRYFAAPPPEYTSPHGSESSGRRRAEAQRALLSRTPIPSYEAATGEAEVSDTDEEYDDISDFDGEHGYPDEPLEYHHDHGEYHDEDSDVDSADDRSRESDQR